MLVDTFQRQKQHEYERILELCHLHGVPLSKNLLQKGMRRMGYISLILIVAILGFHYTIMH